MSTATTHVRRGYAMQRFRVVLVSVLVLLIGIAVGLLIDGRWGSDSSSWTSVHGSGITTTQARHVPSFTAVDLAGSNVVTVRVGGGQSVVVQADDNLIEHVTTEVRNRELVIANLGSFTTEGPMSVRVTVPTLDSIVLSGSGVVAVDGVRAKQLEIRVPGTGVLSVNGAVDRLEAGLTGSGDVRLRDLVAREVAATVAGSGRLQVHATRSLDASVTGIGAISYSGNPDSVIQNITGTGAITKE